MKKQLPKNWVLSNLYDVVEPIKTGVKEFDGYKNYYSTGSVKDNSLTIEGVYTYQERPARANREVQINDVLQARMSDTEKALIITDEINGSLFSTGFMQFRVYENTIDSKYLFYYLKSNLFNAQKNELASGTTQMAINDLNAKKITIPIAPFEEQIRIVDKLDTLFRQITSVKRSMQNIPILLKDFRQQVLTQAVTGKLTEGWRKSKKIDDWRKCVLLDVIIEKPRNGYSPKGVEYETPVKSLTLSATTSGKFNSKCIKYLDIEVPNRDSHLWLKKGDILIQRSNSLEYVGTSAIYDGEDFDFIYPDIMMKIRANNLILNTFLIHVLSSSKTRLYYRNNASGTAGNMPKINQETVCNTPIDLPTIKEQEEIVKRVKYLLEKADFIEQKYLELKEIMNFLPQKLLDKAFNGELTERMESDVEAKDILKSIEILKLKNSKNKIKSGKSVKERRPKSENRKFLIDSIKTILKDKANGISYKELLTNFYDNSKEKLVNDIIEELLSKKIIKQVYNSEEKQMLIKINL